MILNINPFKLAQYICYIGLFVFIFFLLDSNPLTNWAFYCMIVCMMGIDYFSFFNGAIQGTNKTIKQFITPSELLLRSEKVKLFLFTVVMADIFTLNDILVIARIHRAIWKYFSRSFYFLYFTRAKRS